MDLAKVDRLHKALSTDLTVACLTEAATAQEALAAALRLFSDLLAAYLVDAHFARAALRSEIEAYCHDAAAMTRGRLLELRDYDLFDVADEDAAPDEPQESV
jgi:hypothetical protein